MTDPNEPLVLIEQRGHTRMLTLNRPHVRNALSVALSNALVAELHSADDDADTRVILLTGAGGAFCSGVDLKDLSEHGFDGAESVDGNCITHLADVRTPVVGLVSGPAVTGGFELALACDFLIATPDARFADTHSRVGIVPGGGLTARLTEAVGVRRARQMSSTGAYLDADTALAWGVVNEIVPPAQLHDRGWSVAEAMLTADARTLTAVWNLYDALSADGTATAVERESVVNRGWSVAGDEVAGRAKSVVTHGRSESATS
ncbi:enoyl-CoA hydratase [Nocardia jiangxiensis]|uniref:Enoyl-CoA hydratase n=1 Tax=Nocardia jiangxiensis TaxID=282685 RepID=A0ABW6SI26_9NOCA|nr:enoyl-CoA hydratase [Nocardia jiangxiensis]